MFAPCWMLLRDVKLRISKQSEIMSV